VAVPLGLDEHGVGGRDVWSVVVYLGACGHSSAIIARAPSLIADLEVEGMMDVDDDKDREREERDLREYRQQLQGDAEMRRDVSVCVCFFVGVTVVRCLLLLAGGPVG
jgi:hypothetical protein